MQCVTNIYLLFKTNHITAFKTVLPKRSEAREALVNCHTVLKK